MFFYLLYNSTLVKNKKPLNILISGSLIYIILHAILYTSDNSLFRILRTYFWVIFILDCVSISFTYIVIDNGTLLFEQKINFDVNPKPENTILNPNNTPQIPTKLNLPEEPTLLQKTESMKQEIEKLTIASLDKKTEDDSSSDLESDLGSDLDVFERTLRQEYSVSN